jgi:RNA polymerase sigma factor (sigma-70 family)
MSAWMAAAQGGDGRAYAALLRDCVPFIAKVARRRGAPPDRVDDVVQEVLLVIHRARHTYDPTRPFLAWLRVIAERRTIDLLRRIGRQGARELHVPLAYENFADQSEDSERGIDRTAALDQMSRAIADLPERQREAMRYLVVEEQSLSDAAAATGRTKGALKVNLHRALKALRGRFERSGP